MGIIVDLIIIAIVLLSTILAYRKGFVSLAISLCSFVIAIILTLVLYQPVSNLVINTTGIDETIENAIYEKANDIMEENNEDNIGGQIVETAKNEMLPQTSRTIAINIVRAGVMIILIVAIKLALRFVNAIANLITKLPIINQINKAGGMVYGIFRGIIIVYAVLLVLTIPGQINPKNKANQSVDQSFLGKTMYQNNILNVFFK